MIARIVNSLTSNSTVTRRFDDLAMHRRLG